MEVKIKQGEEMLDARIEMVEGVMVVSPKEVKFEPKVGDKYHHPSCSITNYGIRFDSACSTNTAASFDMKILKHNLAFKTKEECQEFCNRLNNAINSVKP